MIVNLTQHNPTPLQTLEGVGPRLVGVPELLTFEKNPSSMGLRERVALLVVEASRASSVGGEVMVGGAPALMALLDPALRKVGLVPVYSFSARRKVETLQPDGTVSIQQVFEHAGWWPQP